MFPLEQGLLLYLSSGMKCPPVSAGTVLLPQLIVMMAYHTYRVGIEPVMSSLTLQTFIHWIENWFVIQRIASVTLTHTKLLYLAERVSRVSF